jgi:transcription elongation factor Elf1
MEDRDKRKKNKKFKTDYRRPKRYQDNSFKCEHPRGAMAYCYYNKKNRENVYQCCECGQYFYQ